MKRFLIIMALAAFIMTAFAGTVNAAWDRPSMRLMYDSLGTVRACNVGDGTASGEVLDTIDTWLLSANGHAVDEALTVGYYSEGMGAYTSCYLWAKIINADSTAQADSNTLYVVLEQSIGGQGTADGSWVPVDSVTINGALPPAESKITLNGSPYFRIRSQDATKTEETDTLVVVVKIALIK